MGTSKLYGGPKKTILLPADFTPEVDPEISPEGAIPSENHTEDVELQNDSSNDGGQPETVNMVPSRPSVTWSTARGSMSNALSSRSPRNVKTAIGHYVKAIGGHSNATRLASTARQTAGTLYAYFSGTPEAIRARFEEAGIQFEGRPTKDIFNDLRDLLAPVPYDLEDSLANIAFQKTIADVVADERIDLNRLDVFDETLLQCLVGGMIKHYIFDKLLAQTEQTVLRKNETVRNIRELEKDIKLYIDGIVDGLVPVIIKSGMNPKDFNSAIETLFDVAYQQMEEML